MRALRERVAAIDRKRLDALLALALLAAVELECWLDSTVRGSRLLLSAVGAALVVAPIAVRRRAPAAALVFASAAMTVQALVGGRLGETSGLSAMLVLAVLAYSVGASLDLRSGLVALLIGAGAFTGFAFLSEPGVSGAIGSDLFVLVVAFLAPWFVGRVARERGRRAEAFRELATLADAEREQHESAAIAQERARIGGELQDIIAHSVSAMVIQAGGARRMLWSDPARARDSILSVEQTGREALADMRRLLGILRKDEDQRALAPQPGLEQLATLLDSVRARSLQCELRIEGEPVDLTPGLDLVGYRVIETALLSAVRHGCRGAVVTVRYHLERLELQIDCDGSLPNLEQELRSMSERVALYDGGLRVARTGGGEFTVRASLPLEAAVPA